MSMSVMNFSKLSVRPPSSQPAACMMREQPASTAPQQLISVSCAACASLTLEAVAAAQRHGSPTMRASWPEAMLHFTSSGVPNAGAPDFMSTFEALKEVQPGGHFFGAAHTMERYQTAFYEPVVADWSNFGTWTERGSRDATTRAHDIYRRVVDEAQPMPLDAARIEELDAYIAKRTQAGGAPPVS